MELKPCPFCGGEAHIVHQSPMTEGVIICNDCKAMVCFPWYKAETGFELKKAWNRRVNENEEMSKVSEMEMAYGEYLND